MKLRVEMLWRKTLFLICWKMCFFWPKMFISILEEKENFNQEGALYSFKGKREKNKTKENKKMKTS